jgi:hypothetical protein
MALKPVSDIARRLLAKMGETPADHQAQVLALASKTYTKSHSSSKVENVHSLNRKDETRLTSSEPISEVVRKMEAVKRVEEEWIPEAYILFIRHSRCSNCGAMDSCLDLPLIFLRHRKSLSAKADANLGLPRLYLPAKVLAYPNLPKLKEVRITSLIACEHCFERSTSWSKKENLFQGATASCGSVAPTPSTQGTERLSDLLQAFRESDSPSKQTELDGFNSPSTYTSEPTGIDSESSENVQDAPVLDLSSHIRKDEAAHETPR